MTARLAVRRGDWLWIAGLAALTLGTFVGVFWNDFVYFDDNLYILDNPVVRQGLTTGGAWLALTRSYAGNWHPVTWLSHMLDVEWFGLDPRGHHGMGLALHVGTAVLFYWALRRLTGLRGASGLAAALFAVHPLHVESVAWAAQRKDLLCGFFWALTLLAYARYVERPGWRRYGGVGAACALCLMAKSMGVTLPLVLLLLDAWPLERWRRPAPDGAEVGHCAWGATGGLGGVWRRLVFEKLPLFALVAFAAAITYVAQSKAGAVISLAGADAASRLANAVLSYWGYLGKMVWPVRLSVFYPYETVGLWSAEVLSGGLALLAVTAVAWRVRRRLPYVLLGWLWYLVTLVPVIGLVQVGSQAMADRYTYLPLLGPFLALGCGLQELSERRPRWRRLLATAATGVVLALGATTQVQVAQWRNTESLFAHALRVTQGNWMAHNNYAGALLAQGREEEAIFHLREALRINPGYEKARLNLALVVESAGRAGEAAVPDRKATADDTDEGRPVGQPGGGERSPRSEAPW